MLTVSKPISPDAALNLSKIVSKLSPLIGNLIEFNIVEFLNDQPEYQKLGEWQRQDPGFPDTIFVAPEISPMPGFEIKAWFPLATEITARFKDSQNHFRDDQTNVCMLAWLPDQLIFGKPKIIDVCVVSARSIAEARDHHYHNPPEYIVREPGNTKERTRNLQQTNTNGFRWQGSSAQLREARKLVETWGKDGRAYKPTPQYQKLLDQLANRFPYRGDTNFAKTDRIVHPGIEEFKARVLGTNLHGLTIAQWSRLLRATKKPKLGKKEAITIRQALAERFDIREEDIAEILE